MTNLFLRETLIIKKSFPRESSLWDVMKIFHKNLVSQRESHFPPKNASVVHLEFIIDERERSGTVEHFCVFQDERTECIYVPENTEKFAEYRTRKAVNPGKKGTEIIECFKE